MAPITVHLALAAANAAAAVPSVMRPTAGHLAWAVLALGLLVGALLLVAHGFSRRDPKVRMIGRLLALAAFLLDLGLIVYRDVSWHRSCPIANNFDSALLFVVMLGGMLYYLLFLRGPRPRLADRPARRPVVDLVLLPATVAVQVLAVLFYFEGFRQFDFKGVWPPMHLGSLIVSSLLLTAAAVAGVMYLVLDRALRTKTPEGLAGGLPSLERLDGLIQHAVLWGFLLLTVCMVSGIMLFVQGDFQGSPELAKWRGKIYVAFAAWVLYAFILATRFWPRMRGRKVAWLTIAGLALLLATYATAQWLAGK